MRNGLLAGVGVAGLGIGWAALSERRPARFLRQLWRDSMRGVPTPAAKPVPGIWPSDGVTVAWLGHATVLLNFYGITVLTDPVFSARVGIDAGVGTLGPKRYWGAALTADELPPIDVVLLSHAHMDHMDLPSLKALKGKPFAVSARETIDILAGTPVRGATELGWGDRTTFRGTSGELSIQAFEVKHWGARWPSERPRGYNGYLLSREGRTIVFGGDTAYINTFADLRKAGPCLAAIMPIGAYDPWIRNHCTPEQALEMAEMAGARRIVPIHHATFKLSDEPMGEPLARLERAVGVDANRIALRLAGETARLA